MTISSLYPALIQNDLFRFFSRKLNDATSNGIFKYWKGWVGRISPSEPPLTKYEKGSFAREKTQNLR